MGVDVDFDFDFVVDVGVGAVINVSVGVGIRVSIGVTDAFEGGVFVGVPFLIFVPIDFGAACGLRIHINVDD